MTLLSNLIITPVHWGRLQCCQLSDLDLIIISKSAVQRVEGSERCGAGLRTDMQLNSASVGVLWDKLQHIAGSGIHKGRMLDMMSAVEGGEEE